VAFAREELQRRSPVLERAGMQTVGFWKDKGAAVLDGSVDAGAVDRCVDAQPCQQSAHECAKHPDTSRAKQDARLGPTGRLFARKLASVDTAGTRDSQGLGADLY